MMYPTPADLLRQLKMAASPQPLVDVAAAAADLEDEQPLADPGKLAWMRDSADGLTRRIPNSVFALGDLASR